MIFDHLGRTLTILRRTLEHTLLGFSITLLSETVLNVEAKYKKLTGNYSIYRETRGSDQFGTVKPVFSII